MVTNTSVNTVALAADQCISGRILALVAQGKNLRDAWNAVVRVISYDDFVSQVYADLRGDKTDK